MSENKIKINEHKFSLAALFSNDKALLVFSMITAFFIWVVITANGGETVNYPVSDIPVTMELSEDAQNDNLTVVSINGVSVDEFTATVRVKGNSVTVGSLNPGDIQVYGSNLGNIVTSGSYNVNLLARQLGVKTNYEIVSIDPSEISIIVDRNITKKFDIDTTQITVSSPAEYFMGSPALSEKSVSISGPEQSVSKIARAIVTGNIDHEVTETTVLRNLEVKLIDADGNEIEDDSITIDPITVDVTVPVLQKKIVPVVLEYNNKPSLFDSNEFITLEPAQIEIAASSDVIDTINSISVGALDFKELSYGMTSKVFEVVMPEGVKNINNVDNVVAHFNFDSYSTKSFVVTNVSFVNVPEGFSAEYSSYKSLLVRVVGPKAAVSNLKISDVSAVVDLTDAKSGTSEMPVSVTISKPTSCWVFGEYSINVTVSDKPSTTSIPESNNDSDSSGISIE